jgi:hypothetical protein
MRERLDCCRPSLTYVTQVEGVDLALDLVIGGLRGRSDTYVSHSETQLFVDSLATAMTGTKGDILEKPPQ